MKGEEYAQYEKSQSNKVGRSKEGPDTPPARTLPLCNKCFCLVKRGVSHICQKTQKSENLASFVAESSGKTKEKVTSNVLKSICADKGESTSGGTIYLGTGSKPIPVTVGKPKVLVKRPKFTIDSLKRLKTSMNLSDRQTLKVAAAFRVVGGRKSVESNLSKKLVPKTMS